jgi:heptosyltransferase-2
LRQQFPAAHLEVLGYPHIAQLAMAGGLVDRVQSIEAGALAGFFARNGALNEDLADYFSEFDIIVSYLYDPDSIFQINVARCTPAQFIIGPHRADDKGKLHASEAYLKPLERLAIFGADHVPRLSVKAAVPRNRLALHPGSGSERKNWPEAQWAALLEKILQATTYDLLLLGGEAETERVQRLAAALPPTRTQVAQSRPLAEVAAELQQCVLFVGHDSGISHLAAAVGLPGLILWGETAAQVWRPPSAKIKLLHHQLGLQRLDASAVFQELLSILPRS